VLATVLRARAEHLLRHPDVQADARGPRDPILVPLSKPLSHLSAAVGGIFSFSLNPLGSSRRVPVTGLLDRATQMLESKADGIAGSRTVGEADNMPTVNVGEQLHV
jgi:hypothetical protein